MCDNGETNEHLGIKTGNESGGKISEAEEK